MQRATDKLPQRARGQGTEGRRLASDRSVVVSESPGILRSPHTDLTAGLACGHSEGTQPVARSYPRRSTSGGSEQEAWNAG